MELWSLIVSAIFSGTGVGSFFLAAWKLRGEATQAKRLVEQAEKLNEANIKRVQAEMTLQLEQSRKLIIDDLQEERTKAQEAQAKAEGRTHDLEEAMSVLRSRVAMLEGILSIHNIAYPK